MKVIFHQYYLHLIRFETFTIQTPLEYNTKSTHMQETTEVDSFLEAYLGPEDKEILHFKKIITNFGRKS